MNVIFVISHIFNLAEQHKGESIEHTQMQRENSSKY